MSTFDATTILEVWMRSHGLACSEQACDTGTMRAIRKVRLPLEGLDGLVSEASAEGYSFLDRLQKDWASGANCFSATGEAFYGVFEENVLVAIGALSQDPFASVPFVMGSAMGRLRRIYVRAAWRKQGIGSMLVSTMLADARACFRMVRLRADNAGAARVYEALGFQPLVDEHATHILHFKP